MSAELASASDTISGLSEREAAARLASEGYNELPSPDRRTLLGIVLEVVREPMLALLLGGGVVYMALGDLKEAIILLIFATLSVVITVVQEARTERVLETLRDLTSPRALVIRDGIRKRIAGREVARGDVMVLSEGDRVAADAVLLQADDLLVDESLLTGESVPVRKLSRGEADATTLRRPGGDDQPAVYSGSLVVRGGGLAEVVATGPRSEIGKIGQALGSLQTEAPRLQIQTRAVVRTFGFIAAGFTALVVVLYGTLRDGWLDAVLAGITVGMSMLPEEFPVVLTVFMAMGAWRISQARVLTRRAAAIEALGSATVLCTDKTGTLTENRMSVAELRLTSGEVFRPREGGALPVGFATLLETGLLAAAPDPFDPMDQALHRLAGDHLPGGSGDRTLVHSYGLRRDLLAMTQVWRDTDDRSDYVVAAKGAPEAIARMCGLDDATLGALSGAVDAMATEGLRVLGVARTSHPDQDWPATQLGFRFEFLGLVGLADPLRAAVPAAVADCRAAGIRVVMITGDYPATAQAIARQAGIDAETCVTGEEIAALDDAALAERLRRATVFARIMPEQKLRIVQALKADGEVVAMTGDGVNDAPSLKAAHIGIAMGGRGTDVAREASAIVLLDDDFASIVKAVRLGRRIYDNLVKAMGFIFAVHVPIAGLALLPLLFGLPILLGPIHIAFLEMIIDPVCSIVFEAETAEDDAMRRPPRDPEQPLFSRALIVWGMLQGLLVFLLVAGVFVIGQMRAMPDTELRALTFFALVLSFVGLIFVNRSFSASLLTALRRPNAMLAGMLGIVAVVLIASLAWPWLRDLFRFGPLHPDDLGLTAAAALLVLIVLELVKPLWRKMMRQPG
ncbi:Calcium-transporting ATPase 1 [Rhodopseudomonas palustris]|uniref:Cation-translocating P-type ATPase n=1 Tax=Rhodopseudomonas palustris (strain ATCC BAA-98 / CGA009) TaxID=258594 RepID=Q6N5S7_RHOPA|nr:cation-translocating P-type ATPase [Rhodopseudomonas palustris]OPF89887.1 ATPase [Rhodopseudomonas palustris]QQM04426.1 Calcium-transporting ATPase 1 [Rhodopseudomonas palustris]RJF65937.1 cation-translocating P-type ATPase [Rhodopseudomonas palustris]WAB75813.1 cation-translocating P-type ATPase [Rhodopseudomonas palustris]WCL93063.1 cation-translocating P-type ATPase [Rhodopseudomonas palustris CGA009]